MDLPKLHARITMLAQTRAAMQVFKGDSLAGFDQVDGMLVCAAERAVAEAATQRGDHWFVVRDGSARSFADDDAALAFALAYTHDGESRRLAAVIREQQVGEAVSYPAGRQGQVLVLRLPGGTLNV